MNTAIILEVPLANGVSRFQSDISQREMCLKSSIYVTSIVRSQVLEVM